MDKFTYSVDTYLPASALKVGHVYLIRDGKIVVYLGKSKYDKYVFYTVARYLRELIGNTKASFAHYKFQVPMLIQLIKNVMSDIISNSEFILVVGSLPQIYCEFPFVNFEDTYLAWYSKNQMVTCFDLPELMPKNIEFKSIYVGSKELEIGSLYYSGCCYGSIYLYCGRNKYNEFCWCPIDNLDFFLTNPYGYIKDMGIVNTKANKRVRPLAMALEDPDALVTDAVRLAVCTGFKVNLENLGLSV